jgi:hypothetical protein
VPAVIEAGALPLLKDMLEQEVHQLPTRPIRTVISCVRLLTDKPLGARSVLPDQELCKVVLDAATSVMSDWCYQQEHGTTVQAITAETCSNAVITVANLLATGNTLRSLAVLHVCHTT